MFEDLKKTFDKGMEYAFSTRDKIEKSVKDFAKENNLNKDEAKKLLDQMLKKSDAMRKDLEKKIVEIQKAAIDKMDLVTKADYKKLEDRIKKLEGKTVPVAAKPKVVKKPAVRKKA
jgi:polyhydroxyalkanoate synthesis regulator phasin